MGENGYPRLLSISIRIRLNYADIHPDTSISYPFTSLGFVRPSRLARQIISDAEADVVDVTDDMEFDMEATIDRVIAVLREGMPDQEPEGPVGSCQLYWRVEVCPSDGQSC